MNLNTNCAISSAEVILADREFTLAEIECIEEYLENKYFPTQNPSPQPTIQPTDPPTPFNRTCPTDIRFNIHFVMDESNSIQPTDYNEQILFLQILTYSDVNPVSKVAILEFAHGTDVIWNFYDDQGTNRFPIYNALEQERITFLNK